MKRSFLLSITLLLFCTFAAAQINLNFGSDSPMRKMQMAEIAISNFYVDDVDAVSYTHLIVGILAPIAEELIFRGAILRVLLNTFEHKGRWIAIALTALIFAFIHGNIAQGVQDVYKRQPQSI